MWRTSTLGLAAYPVRLQERRGTAWHGSVAYKQRKRVTEPEYSYLCARRVVAVTEPMSDQERRYVASCESRDGHTSFTVRASDEVPAVGSVANRFRTAVKWVKELDAWADGQLRAGREVRISLPSTEQIQRVNGGRPGLGRVLMPALTRRRRRWPLYKYQRAGVTRLLASERCLLADDMGLGKTMQVVVAIAKLLERGDCRRFLVVAPRSVLEAWRSEFARWAPTICVRKADGTGGRAVFRECWGVGHVLLTNYEQTRNRPSQVINDAPGLVVLDEAHRVKNWDSQVATGLRTIDVARVWVLTGTPLEKGKVDLVGLMSFLDPKRFSQRDRYLPSWLLRAKTRPYVLRREKADVLGDLPSVTYTCERVRLQGAQKRAYRRALEASASSKDVLASVTKLRKLCDYEPMSGTSAKVDRAMTILRDICCGRAQKAVVFSYLLKPLELLQSRICPSDVPVVGVYQGSLTERERTAMLDRYRKLKKGVLLASMRAAGEGLTLTDANNVVLINRWWNPSSNAQAIDRVHRIGQRLPVTVYYFEAVGTIEERLSEILADKEELFDEVITRLAHSQDFVPEGKEPEASASDRW